MGIYFDKYLVNQLYLGITRFVKRETLQAGGFLDPSRWDRQAVPKRRKWIANLRYIISQKNAIITEMKDTATYNYVPVQMTTRSKHLMFLPKFNIWRQRRQYTLCFVAPASWNNRVKKNQLNAQLILSIFHQPLHVSGVSRPIIRRYNRTTIATYYSF